MKMEHANITVKSIDEAVRFLGTAFPESVIRGEGHIHGDADQGRWVHFGTDQHYVALQENSAHTPHRDVTYTSDGINHLGFVVEGLDDLISRMTVAGYKVTAASALEGHPWRRRAYFYDGNGVEWEFIEYLSDKPEERNDYAH